MRFRKKARWAIAAIVVVALASYLLRGRSNHVRYVTAPVTRGAIVRKVVATGTVNPVITVQVGSYVSGPIQAIYADFNSPVKTGQLIAKIDPRPYKVKVDEAAAAVANSKAQLGKDEADADYKRITYGRDQKLLDANAASRDTVDAARSAYLQARAQVALDKAMIQEQEAMLNEASVNLGYTNIVAPVDGTVVSRNVDVGQTVAASFQTPTLFLIAKDLTRMEVDTNVSESDIGNVKTGERAEFHVDAFPDRTFIGSVGQVRQAPITVQNVVTYDVVVDVVNPELLLKPGMTADVTIITASRENVLRLPIEALRFSPAELDGGDIGGPSVADSSSSRIWIVRDGVLSPITVRTGLGDGTNAELLDGDLKVGEKVVTDEIRPMLQASSAPSLGSPPHFH